MQIQGKTALITGAGSGIGRAAALALARRGASILVADLGEEAGNETVRLITEAGGKAHFQRCDVTDSTQLNAIFAAAVQQFGRLDIVCNNAGIGGESILEDEANTWKKMVDINLTAMLEGTAIAVRDFRKRGVNGVIINTASMGGLLPMPGSPVYAATKAGVVNFSRSLAYLADEGIRVNAICPSFTDTPLVRRDGDARVGEITKAMGGILDAEFVAEGFVELVEDNTRAGAIMRVTVQRGRDYAREIRP